MKVLILIALCCFTAQAQYKIESNYDRFTDQTTVRAFYFHVGTSRDRTINLEAYYVYRGNGERPELPTAAALRFISGGNVSFMERPTLFVLADERRHQFSRLPGEYSKNIATFIIPWGDFQNLLDSKHLEMRVGQEETDLSKETLKGLREFAERKVSP